MFHTWSLEYLWRLLIPTQNNGTTFKPWACVPVSERIRNVKAVYRAEGKSEDIFAPSKKMPSPGQYKQLSLYLRILTWEKAYEHFKSGKKKKNKL